MNVLSQCVPLVLCLALISSAVSAQTAWPRHVIDNRSRGADGVRLADVNGDGWMDLATGWEEGGQARVYLHPGPLRVRDPWPHVTVGRVASPEDAVFADVDRDGSWDVVSCCEGRNRTVYVHWAPAEAAAYLQADRWQTEAVPCTQGNQMWMFALPFDVDATGGTDLVVGSKGEQASIGWLEIPRDARQLDRWRWHRLCRAGWIMSLCSADMDRDGDQDILASDRKGPTRGVLWLENPGPESTRRGGTWQIHRLDQGDREVMFLRLADFDGRRRSDIFCAVRGRGILHLTRPDQEQEPWNMEELPWPSGCGTGKGVALGDLDGDGRTDLVFTCENANGSLSGVRWMRKDSATGRWRDHEISGPDGVKFDRVELLDLDGDGDLDVLTCEERDNLGVIWYENQLR